MQLNFIEIDDRLVRIKLSSRKPHTKENAKKTSQIILQLLFYFENDLRGTIRLSKTKTVLKESHANIIDVLTSKLDIFGKTPKWLYCSDGRCVNPSEISKSELDTDLYGEVKATIESL